MCRSRADTWRQGAPRVVGQRGSWPGCMLSVNWVSWAEGTPVRLGRQGGNGGAAGPLQSLARGCPGGCRLLSWGSELQDAGERGDRGVVPEAGRTGGVQTAVCRRRRGGAARAPQPGRAQRPSAPRPFSFWDFLWPLPPPPTTVFHPLVCIEALSRLGTARSTFPKIPAQGSNAGSVPPRSGTVHGRPLSPRLPPAALPVLSAQEARETPRSNGEEGTKLSAFETIGCCAQRAGSRQLPTGAPGVT